MTTTSSIRESLSVPGMHANRLGMITSMERFLQLRAEGLTVVDACKAVPIAHKTYEKWRIRYPEFREACEGVRLARMMEDDVALAKDDFAGFRLTYFKHYSPPFHLRIINVLENAKPGSITMVLVPPNHGKTTLLTDWICNKLAYDANHRILYISESSKLASKVLGRVKRRMTDPTVAPKYQRDFGPFYEPGQEKQSKPWAAEYMTLYKSNHDEQDYSLEAMGWVSQIYGVRSDTIVLDDFQTLKTAEKGNTTEAMVDKFQQDIYTRIDPDDGKIIIIGTRVAQNDFYIQLIEQGDVVDDIIIMPAIDWQGRALWNERLPIPKLEALKKKVGPKIWSRAYMMAPQDDGAATFTQAVIDDCKRPDLKVWDPPAVDEDVWASVDPAIDKYTGISSAAIATDHFRLMSSQHFYELSTGEAILSQIYQTWQRTHFSRLVVEAVSFQKALARDERLEAMRRECGFTIVEHTTASNKLDKTFGVARMASSFIDQTIWVPAGDAESVQHFQALIAELVAWRSTIPTRLRVQDLVMSLWFLWLQWQNLRRTEREGHKGPIMTSGMPFKPTGYQPGMLKYRGVIGR